VMPAVTEGAEEQAGEEGQGATASGHGEPAGTADDAQAGTAPPAPGEPPPSAIRPQARRPATSPKRDAARKAAANASNGGAAPVDHYDDLEADEIVTLLGSLEDDDLDALLAYERANLARPRVTSAIEGARARRQAAR
jgi:hypothetical protein